MRAQLLGLSFACGLAAAILPAGCREDPARMVGGRVLVELCQGSAQTACTATGAAADADDPTPSCVVASETGASVFAMQGDPRVAVTDENGAFRLGPLSPGRYGVAATAKDTVELRQVRVAEVQGAVTPEIVFTFTAAGGIDGRVLFSEELGEPTALAGIEVRLVCPPLSAFTDAEGHFRFTRVPAGQRRVTAVGPGIVAESTTAHIIRGQNTEVVLMMEDGRPPDEPMNQPPAIGAAITTLHLPADDDNETFLRPPSPEAGGAVRGDRLRLSCEASDPDGDPLRYVWSASSGTLEAAGGDNTAILTAGADDIGVSCTVLDGRGGVAATHLLLPVHDPYFAGGALFGSGAVFANAFAGRFDLVLSAGSDVVRVQGEGNQWLPRAFGSTVAYINANVGPQALFLADLVTASEGAPALLPVEHVTVNAAAFAVLEAAVAWIDNDSTAWLTRVGGARVLLRAGVEPTVATAPGIIGLGTASDTVLLFREAGTLQREVETPGRRGGAFAVWGERVAYWGDGVPRVITATTTLELGPERAPTGSNEQPKGRMLLAGDIAAYSHYESPLKFVEATVVAFDDSSVTGRQRAAIGPSEVLDMDDTRLLIGRPRGAEAVPSEDLWVVSLASLALEAPP